MNKTTILDLDNKKAKKFFLDEKNYCNFDLPEYFSFQELLNKIDDYDTELTLEKSLLNRRIFPSKYEGVNYRLINNKDGEYAWRPYELVHPVLYVCLVNQITTDG
jgi:RNA-directed DNA polymerase